MPFNEGKPKNHYMEVYRYEKSTYDSWNRGVEPDDPEFRRKRYSVCDRRDDAVKESLNIKLWKHGFIFFATRTPPIKERRNKVI